MTTEQTLPFGKKSIRAVVSDDDVWFAAADLYATQRTHTDKQALSRFDAVHLRLHTFETPTDSKRLTLVSTLGALTIAKRFSRPSDRIVDLWLRKKVTELGFPRPPLTLCADGTMPVCPRASDYEGREAWDALWDANRGLTRRPAVEGLKELNDDDETRPPTPEEIMANLNAALFGMEDAMLAVTPKTPRKRPATKTRAKRK